MGGDLPSLENDTFTTGLLTNEGILEMNCYGNNSHPVNTSFIPVKRDFNLLNYHTVFVHFDQLMNDQIHMPCLSVGE